VSVPTPLPPCPSLRNEPCRTYKAFTDLMAASGESNSVVGAGEPRTAPPSLQVRRGAERSPASPVPSVRAASARAERAVLAASQSRGSDPSLWYLLTLVLFIGLLTAVLRQAVARKR
jgi:hypothetical protein